MGSFRTRNAIPAQILLGRIKWVSFGKRPCYSFCGMGKRRTIDVSKFLETTTSRKGRRFGAFVCMIIYRAVAIRDPLRYMKMQTFAILLLSRCSSLSPVAAIFLLCTFRCRHRYVHVSTAEVYFS